MNCHSMFQDLGYPCHPESKFIFLASLHLTYFVSNISWHVALIFELA